MNIKIAIITIAHGTNYGNKLQNFALTKVLTDFGYEVETLKQKESLLSKVHNILHVLKKPKSFIKVTSLNRIRAKSFELFNGNYLKYSSHSFGPNTNIVKYSDKYDYFVLGSDQIWNPNFRMYNRALMFGYGLKPGKAIPYAPSFGSSTVPAKERDRIALYLNSLERISVREEQGVNIVKELTGRDDAVQVLDPTLLLDAKDYRKILHKPDGFDTHSKYIVTYFLGAIPQSLMTSIKNLAKDNNLMIVDFNNINNSNVFSYGPSEFLYIFDNAELILTDSFHATVFSTIFERPFVVFDRAKKGEASMNSRIDSLLDLTGLHSRRNLKLTDKKIFNVNYSYVKGRVMKKRSESLNFLKESIKT